MEKVLLLEQMICILVAAVFLNMKEAVRKYNVEAWIIISYYGHMVQVFTRRQMIPLATIRNCQIYA